MTKKEILSLYKQAYKEASDYDIYDSYERAFKAFNPAKESIKKPSKVSESPSSTDARKAWNEQQLNQEFDKVWQRMYNQSNSPLDYQRRALAQIYGQNHLNSLDDNAYVQRRWNAAMRGSRVRQLMAAYQQARQTGNGMTAGAGMLYGGESNAARLNRPYGISTSYRRPIFARPQARGMNGAPPASQQAAQPPKPQNTTTSTIPNDLRKEVIGSLGNNTMTA